MYQLTVKIGANQGQSWPISDKSLVVGRSRRCDVWLPDPTISRNHCEVALRADHVHIRDLGSSNMTLINGVPLKEAELKIGDEVSVGSTVFLISSSASLSLIPVPEKHKSDDTIITLSISQSAFIQERNAEFSQDLLPRTVKDLHELFTISRRLSHAVTMTALVDMLIAALQARFTPVSAWLAWAIGDEPKLSFYPVEGSALEEDAPTRHMHKALQRASGLLIPRAIRRESERSLETTMIAPLLHGRDRIGVIAVRSASPERVYEETDLDFLVSLAHTFAPFVRSAERVEQLRRDYDHARRIAGVSRQLVGESSAINEVRRLVAHAASSSLNVLIRGETGVGKELAARMVHDLSSRAGHPYVIVNCAAIPRELFESEMFGYEKGAFTGASRQKVGRFEEAHGGTLFLDEIGDLSPDNQARILRAIESGTFYRVGGDREIRVDVRVLAATNRSLKAPSDGVEFRSDLYHRLCGFEILLPPLRERSEDIVPLARHFLEQFVHEASSPVSRFSDAAIERLRTWPWPGNVRELRACVARAVALTQNDTIDVENIVLQSGPETPAYSTHFPTLAEIEKEHVIRALHRFAGNVRTAASSLGISRATLYNKIKEYGIAVRD